MQPAPVRLNDLPGVFPVFPLAGALLLPRGRLPLNIFEPRYLAITEDALAAGRMLGMIQPDPAGQPGATGPALYRVGCLGRLCSFSETDDGRYLITLTGLARFAVAEELEMRRGYRRIRGEFSGFAGDLQAPEALAGFDRAALLATLRPFFARRGIEANWDAINCMADEALVSTLAMVCPFDPAEKQALLEASGPAERAATLATLLQMEIHAPGDGAQARSRAS